MLFLTVILLFSPLFFVDAYLDPGSGSFIIQLIVGALLGGIIAFKSYFKKVISFFVRHTGRKKKKKKDNE